MQFIKKIIHEQTTSIGVAALIVAFFGIFSRILGLIRDRILAANYGAGEVLDIYYAAFRIPDFIFELLIVGSLAAAFVPFFTGLIARGDHQRAWRCANDLLLVLLGVVSVLSLVGYLFAAQLMAMIAPGFSDAALAQATEFMRWMFLSPFFLSISALLGGVLVAEKRFILYSSAPLLYNVGIITGVVFFVPRIGDIGLACGVVFGSFLHFCIHLFAAKRIGFRWLWPRRSPYRNPDVKAILRTMLPRVFGSASNQISLFLTIFFASGLAAGSLTIFTFAHNIQSVILGIVGVSFALAAFPVLAKAHATDEQEYFTEVYIRTLRRILYYVVPLSIIMWVLRAQIVRLVYGAGYFDKTDTALTISVLSYLLISLFAQSMIPLMARAFYARGDTKTPLWCALASQVVNIVTIVALIDYYDVVALAMAFSIASMVNAGMLLLLSQKFLKNFKEEHFVRSILITALASLIAAGVTHVTKDFVGNAFGTMIYVWQFLIQTATAASAGILMYLGIGALFGLEEFDTIRNKIIVRMFGRASVAAEEQNHG